MNTQSRWAAALLFLLPIGLFPIGPGWAADPPPPITPLDAIEKQWARSPHAGSTDTVEERALMNREACAPCHTAQGYWEVILDGRRSSAPYENPAGLTCIACHLPAEGAAPQPGLRAGSPEQACAGCHDLTRQGDAEGSSACTQGSVLLGAGLPGRTPDERAGGHSRVPRGCVGCHMARPPADVDDPPVGGHTFRVASNGAGPRILNAYACRCCHALMNDEIVRASQERVRALLAELAALLPKASKGQGGSPQSEPVSPGDPSLTPAQSRAASAYYMVLRDGTYGAHDPAYARGILEEAIAGLKAAQAAPRTN